MYHWYRWYMTAQKRPRIDQYVAQAINDRRGSRSFEEYVNHVLRQAVGNYWLEPTEKVKGRFDVLTHDGKVVATGLGKGNAERLAADLDLLHQATTATYTLYENMDESTDPVKLQNEVLNISQRLLGMIDEVAGRD